MIFYNSDGGNVVILASDFDNTLYIRGHFKKDDLKAIKAFQEAGGKFGVCTGRPLLGIVAPTLGKIKYDFYICNSGGAIYDQNRDVLMMKKIPLDLAHELISKVHVDVSIIHNEKMLFYYYKKIPKILHPHQRVLKSLDSIDDDFIMGMSFHFPKGQLAEAKACTDMINEQYFDHMSAFQNNEHVDICANGCSKGAGLKFIEDYFNTPHHKVGAIGDSFNDISLLQAGGVSFTFDYGPDDLKKEADYIVGSVGESLKYLL